MDWKTIQTVFLDMDGTLLDLHFDNYFWLEYIPIQYAKQQKISIEEAKQQLKTHYQAFQGTLDWYCIDHWGKHLGMDIEALKHKTAQRIQIRTKVLSFLEFLKQQQQHVVLLTNAHPKTIRLKFQYAPIEPYFNRIISAHDIGLAKEQTGFWETLQQQFDFDRRHSLFIDDNLDVLRCAQHYNIAYLLAIHQPDSQQAAVETETFTALKCFSQLIETTQSL
ncbi:MAG: GMP/IMP nucleotidase [Cocleimonas sp.]|nr:GMP/IMP nucleotidase [Cocleimonas sp.]